MRKALSVFLAFMMVFGLTGVGLAVESPNMFASGECGARGDRLVWTLTNDGVLTITGAGKMADYPDVAFSDAEIGKWKDARPGRSPWMTAIGNALAAELGYRSYDGLLDAMAAFAVPEADYLAAEPAFLEKMKTVVIGEGVTSIGENAFSEWTASSFSLPSTLTYIGPGAFKDCGLTEFTIPAGVTEIAPTALVGNPLLETLTVESETLDISELQLDCHRRSYTDQSVYAEQSFIRDMTLTILSTAVFQANIDESVDGAAQTYGVSGEAAARYVNRERRELTLKAQRKYHLFADSRQGMAQAAYDLLARTYGFKDQPFAYVMDCDCRAELTPEVRAAFDVYAASGGDTDAFDALIGYLGFAVTTPIKAHSYAGWNGPGTEEAYIESVSAAKFEAFNAAYGTDVQSLQALADASAARISLLLGNDYTPEETVQIEYDMLLDFTAYGESVIDDATGVDVHELYMEYYSDAYAICNWDSQYPVYAPYGWLRIAAPCGAAARGVVPEKYFMLSGHTYGEGVETAAPTCGEPGETTFTCACGETSFTEPIPATGAHTWSDWVVVTPETATRAGERMRGCTVCGEEEHETIPASGQNEPSGFAAFWARIMAFFERIRAFFRGLFS